MTDPTDEHSAPTGVATDEPVAEARLHISDVEFRGETIYFIVLDRFHDGFAGNVGEREDLNDPTRTEWGRYWGGDLQGVIDKLDYLQGLGVTAIWLTPLFEQVEGLINGLAPMHGYWARDFKRMNSRWVNDPADVNLFEREKTIFDELLTEMHRRGMKFVLDVVCNHSSPPTDVGKGKLYDQGRLIADYDNDVDHWYHHYGDVLNWEDEWQIQNCELAALATFNENNTAYRRYIKEAFGMWLDRGVDAFRVDTVKHMPLWFWQEFTSDLQARKSDVFIFGEWIHSSPALPASVDFANLSGMTILDFGFCNALRSCLGQGSEAGWLEVQALIDQDHKYRGATELVTFYENHDMPRLQSLGASESMLYLATACILMARGIPCLYYGAEQALHNDTDGGNDPYNRPMMERWDQDTPIYRMVGALSAERRRNPAIQLGGHWPKLLTPNVYAFGRRYQDSRAFTVLNRGPALTLTIPDTEMPDGVHRCVVSGREVTVQGGTIEHLELAEHGICVLSLVGAEVTSKCVVRLQVNGIQSQPGDTLVVIGDCPELGEWDPARAVALEYINSNTWFGELPFDHSAGRTIAYKLALLPAGGGAPLRENCTSRRRSIPEAGYTKWRDNWAG